MQKSLQRKWLALHAKPSRPDIFVLGDAKESDLALRGLPPAIARSLERPDANFPYSSREAWLDQLRELLEDSLLDMILVSPELAREVAGKGGIFDHSPVSAAVRSVPGHWMPPPAAVESGPVDGGPLPVFGVGYCRDRAIDARELDQYENFRRRAGAARTRHLLELYPSCGCDGGPPKRVDDVLADRLLHSILEVSPTARPAMIHAPYYGPRLMEQIVACLPGIPVGIVGGAAGTTFDAFSLLVEAARHGARGALFGRRIAAAEHQPSFVRFLDYLSKGEVSPVEAVHAYHGVLQALGIRPFRDLAEDLLPTSQLHRGDEASNASVIVPEFLFDAPSRAPAPPREPAQRSSPGSPGPTSSSPRPRPEPEPDFARMSPQEKLDYNQRRRDSIFG